MRANHPNMARVFCALIAMCLFCLHGACSDDDTVAPPPKTNDMGFYREDVATDAGLDGGHGRQQDASSSNGLPSTSSACPIMNVQSAEILACGATSDSCSSITTGSPAACFEHRVFALPEWSALQLRENSPTVVQIGTGDLNDDGHVEIIALVQGDTVGDDGRRNHALVVYWGDSSASYGFAEVLDLVGEYAGVPRVADLDRDGHTDIVVVGSSAVDSIDVIVWYGSGTQTFDRKNFAISATEGPLYQVETLEIGDLDGDGDEDLVLDGGSWLEGLGARTFGVPQPLPLADMRLYRLVAIRDLDKDGARDLVGSLTPEDGGAGTMSVIHGMGDGNSADVEPLSDGMVPLWFGVTDVNADAFEDLVGVGGVPKDLGAADKADNWVLATFSWIAASDGSYPTEPVITELSRYLAPGGQSRLLSSDFNHDGANDLVYVARIDADRCDVPVPHRAVRILLGDDAGGFTEPSCMPRLEEPPSALSVADVNEDGADDIVVGTRAGIELLSARAR